MPKTFDERMSDAAKAHQDWLSAGGAEPCDILVMVGGKYYPTIANYLKEVQKLGVCRRVGSLPPELVVGKSRLFLAHRDRRRKGSVIFGYCTIHAVEVISDEMTDVMRDLDVQPISFAVAEGEPPRGCGKRGSGGFYLCGYVSHEDIQRVSADERAETGIRSPGITLLENYIKIPQTTLRGYAKVDGDAILRDRRIRYYGTEEWR